MTRNAIHIRNARQNNLRNLDLDIPLGELVVVTGVSGSGKSSLAFDTVYAEGQRRYVETFSPYARQFLDRMDKPAADRIDGIPPAIAIDQTNPVRTSRSTVGTMTELNDHLKLLFARLASLYCSGCGAPVRRDDGESVALRLLNEAAEQRVMVTATLPVPTGMDKQQMQELLERQGYTRFHRATKKFIEVVVDRLRVSEERRDRLVEAIENALRLGRNRVAVYPLDDNKKPGSPWPFSADLHCPDCDLAYREPFASLFSFNSPAGACPDCRGFGRTMGIDYDLVIPDHGKTLAEGTIRPWQSGQSAECQDDLLLHARMDGVPVDVPWRELSEEHKSWVIDGEGRGRDKWYGVKRYFDWLERKSYRMHVRVLLSRYRSYELCPACDGARLRPEALCRRVGSADNANTVLEPAARFRPHGSKLSDDTLQALPGLHIHDLMQLPLDRLRRFFDALSLPGNLDQAGSQLLDGIRTRLHYLVEVGLGYLTLDRQSRTLSGGEVQRINLTTALGTSLVNTLFVLDEPSIGLHPRDMQRIVGVMRRLRDAGNSLLVVEHDPDVMRAADRVLDIGPGPGERGGELVFNGTPEELVKDSGSLTGAYLGGRRNVLDELPEPGSAKPRQWLRVRGASAHNLRNIDVRIPLQRLVVLTGVSGSGKSTLMQDVLWHALARLKGHPDQPPGAHRAIEGHQHFDDVVLVDQSAIGKTTRSNPASYVGAFDAIRKTFVNQPQARERGYTPGTFSFNTGNGRCPACGGNGFEHVEMQFLSDVYLRCAECDGRRYRDEILEIRVPPPPGCELGPRSIAGVLELTVTEASGFFADNREVLSRLEPLEAVGLGYLKLGQPVPTLSGGEAQRLKLAGHLAKAAGQRGSGEKLLFLFDEPTTGLHFADIAVLLGAFRRLQAEGHSLLVIEHNLDVMRAADWLIDMGPEGGDGGGEIVCEGTPEAVMAVAKSHTGRALAAYTGQQTDTAASLPAAAEPAALYTDHAITIRHAREHNLKNIDVRVPRDKLTVITGLSGSGKSTVAFDILFNEGQRRYLESLNAYARQFVQPAARPDVDAILGIPPTVAIEQRTSRGGRKSTVGTLTEIAHFLRLLYVKLGTQHCPDCDIPIDAQSAESILAQIQRDWRGQEVELLAPLIVARKGYYTDLAKWAAARGFEHLRVDGEATPTANWPRLDRYREHDIELPVGRVKIGPDNEAALRQLIRETLDYGQQSLKVACPGHDDAMFSARRACPGCGRSFAEPDPRLFSWNSKHGWCPECFGTGALIRDFDEEQTGEENTWLDNDEDSDRACPACHGRRLNPVARAVRFDGRGIDEISALAVDHAATWADELSLDGRDQAIARDILPEIRNRLAFLREVGLGYLSLDRAAPTLSGGEAQRIRLAAQLGSNLQGVCYILDEPTIGLHPRDNRMLLDTLARLEGKGNTIVVVEHDEDTIRRAEHVIDLGPGAGINGGRVVAEGTVDDLLANPDSVTGRSLNHPLKHPLSGKRRKASGGPRLKLHGASLNNLRQVKVDLPLERLVVVTGVSGSGKSTLLRDVLEDNLYRRLSVKRGMVPELRGCQSLDDHGHVDRVLEVNQTPIGKTPRSCPATYVGFWDDIRKLYATTEEARIRGYGPGRFSFNTKEGRCPACDGQGMQRIEMSFLPDVSMPCEVCGGQRFTAETLSVTWRGKSVGEVLNMPIEEAVEFFAAQPRIHHPLTLLRDVGLGYLTLGQPSPTLSGGEAQRIKLVSELARARPDNGRRKQPHTLYVLDEPTVGLHMADVENLLHVLHRLVDAGNSVMVIEHNLDLIAEADWLVDMGPEGGDAGGRVVAAGTPEQVAKKPGASHTAAILRDFLAERAHKTTTGKSET